VNLHAVIPQDLSITASPTFVASTLTGDPPLVLSALTGPSGLYINSDEEVTTTPPTSGTLGYWSRTSDGVIFPATANDRIYNQINDASNSVISVENTNSGSGIEGVSNGGYGIRGESTSSYSGYFTGGLGLYADSLVVNTDATIGTILTTVDADVTGDLTADQAAIGNNAAITSGTALDVNETFTGTLNPSENPKVVEGIDLTVTWDGNNTGSPDPTNVLRALDCLSVIGNSASGDPITAHYGAWFRTQIYGGATCDVTNMFGFRISPQINAGYSGNVGSVSGCVVSSALYAFTGTLTDFYGFRYWNQNSIPGTVTNAYGIHLDDIDFGTANCAIYTGAGDVSLGDDLITRSGRICNTDRYTSTQTLDEDNEIVFCDTDGGAFTINLPAGTEGRHYKIINCGSSGYDLTVDPNGTEQLYGGGAGVSMTVSDGEVIDIHYNATEGWW